MALLDRLAEGLPPLAILCISLTSLVFRLCQERQRIGDLCQILLSRLAPCLKPPVDDPLERRVREECIKKRVERARATLIAFSTLIVFNAAFNFFWVIRDQPVDEMAVLYASAVLVAVLNVCPRAITHKTTDLIYCVGMLSLILPAATQAMGLSVVDDWGFAGDNQRVMLVAAFWSIFNLRIWLNAVMTLALVSSLSMQIHGSPMNPESARAFVALMFFLIWLDHRCEIGVRLELRAQDSSSQLSAIRALLNNICDVTVDMDSRLCLIDHSPRLADILFQGPLRSLAGASLQEFMPEEADRKNFDQQLRASDEAAQHTAVFHTKLRDGVGGTIDMELFSVAFRGADDRRRHILGMREFTDIQPMAGLRNQGAGATLRVREEPAAPRNGPGTPASLEQGDLESMGSSANGSQAAAARPAMIATHAVVRRMTMRETLLGWYLPPLDGDCCPWHTLLRAGHQMLDTLGESHCDQRFGTRRSWQCMRCGTTDKSFRRKKKSRCSLCIDVASEELGYTSSAQVRDEHMMSL